MKKSFLLFLILILFSCNNKQETITPQVSSKDQKKHITDSIRKAQEMEVINMDSSSDAEKTLNQDLKKFK